MAIEKVDTILKALSASPQGASTGCALVLVGRSAEPDKLVERWLYERADLVVLYVDIMDDIVRIGLRDPKLKTFLTTLQELAERSGGEQRSRIMHFQFWSARPAAERRSLLEISLHWVHAMLRRAVERWAVADGDVPGFSVTQATLMQSLDAPLEYVLTTDIKELPEVDELLDRALWEPTKSEPLAVVACEFGLAPRAFRLLLLTLAPELDIRYQRCIGFLLDDMSRRVGSLGLYQSLLGLAAHDRREMNAEVFVRWLVFEGCPNRIAASDEPLRVDPFFAQWLLGESNALANDPQVRRALRLEPWPGAELLADQETRAISLVEHLQDAHFARWTLLNSLDPASWRALLERGWAAKELTPIRVEAARLANVELQELEEITRRIARLARLSGNPLVLDVTKADGAEIEADSLRCLLTTLNNLQCPMTVICRSEAYLVRLLGDAPYALVPELALPATARAQTMRKAALGAGVWLTEDSAEAMAKRFPLPVDSLEHAMRLASSRPEHAAADDPSLERFITACKELAAENVSQLVDRLEPVFGLTDVVLPPDRKQQLAEIVDHVRYASQVMDEWKFRDQLPYGEGISVLFSGASGTGKTMAALGVARELGIQVLRLDLSRVVSKYIGDTEKNIDRVFTDAKLSGAAMLIDEADALLGKRSEVKDAHDRYANIEVAYLLQKLEAYAGLVIMTTNMRKSLDHAFLRRFRFLIEFPKPDIEAREKIWRQCLPRESHELDDAMFRQLARRLDLTGGQIRQITIRAAFVAAAAHERIQLAHIKYAVSAELAKVGMPPVELGLTPGLAQARGAA
ncbi:MAG: ATP-binding protein [Acidobacteria bacterium]|nr:ATP-binding protein [Acidobacteriota bacterium]